MVKVFKSGATTIDGCVTMVIPLSVKAGPISSGAITALKFDNTPFEFLKVIR